MKTIKLLAILFISSLTFTACKGKKKAIEPPKGEVEVVLFTQKHQCLINNNASDPTLKTSFFGVLMKFCKHF